MKEPIPAPALERLCSLYNLLCDEGRDLGARLTSAEIGSLLNIAPTNIRKDLSLIGVLGRTGSSYNTLSLRRDLEEKLGLGAQRKGCVVGIGKLGSAILQYGLFGGFGCIIAAGFDSNNNRIETLRCNAKLYPAHKITEVVRMESIEIAFLCVPPASAQVSVNRLSDGGIKGIINFTSAHVTVPRPDLFIRTIDLHGDLRTLSAMISLSNMNKPIKENNHEQSL